MPFRANRATAPQAHLDDALRPASAAHLRPEVVVFRLRRHGRRLVFPAVSVLVIAALGGYFIGSFDDTLQNALAGLGALLAFFLCVLFPLFSWLGQTDTVTTRRVIVRRGFFVRHRSEASLGRIREVRSRRSMMQGLFGSGTVVLMIGSEKPLELVDVPAVESVVDALHELIERSYVLDQGAPSATATLGVSGVSPAAYQAPEASPQGPLAGAEHTGDTRRIR